MFRLLGFAPALISFPDRSWKREHRQEKIGLGVEAAIAVVGHRGTAASTPRFDAGPRLMWLKPASEHPIVQAFASKYWKGHVHLSEQLR